MVQHIEGYTVYCLTNEFQVYEGHHLIARVWRCGQSEIDGERLGEALASLIRSN